MGEYDCLKQRLACGWNTWNTRSVLSHVFLPEGFALNLGLKEYSGGAYLKEALIGRQGRGDEQIHPGPHTTMAAIPSRRCAGKGLRSSSRALPMATI